MKMPQLRLENNIIFLRFFAVRRNLRSVEDGVKNFKAFIES